MTRWRFAAAAVALAIGVLTAGPASAWKRGDVDILATLPFATGSVEGLTVGPDGNIYVPTFGFRGTTALTGNAKLFVISPRGQIVHQLTIANSSPHILGLRFNPATHALWVLDFGAGNVLNVDPNTGTSSILASMGSSSGLNALTFDSAGNGYVSDSFQGIIWQVPSGGGTATPWVTNPSLLGPGSGLTPPFGANGVEFNSDGSILFVANTAFHQIIQIPVSGGVPGTPSVFITGINAPDGIAIDKHGNMWICANQEDEIVVIDMTGKVIAKLGDFRGIGPDGIARGFLFPASLAFSKDGSTLYVSNLTLYLPAAGVPNLAIDSAWTLQVKGYTVSSLPAKIPPFPDGP